MNENYDNNCPVRFDNTAGYGILEDPAMSPEFNCESCQ